MKRAVSYRLRLTATGLGGLAGLGGVALAASIVGCCNPKWLEPSPKTSTEASVAGEPFELFDNSSALPGRSRPYASRRGTVRVTLPATPAEAQNAWVVVAVEALVLDGGGSMMVELTTPDGTRNEARKVATSSLVFCPRPPAPCEATFGVRMTYQGAGGTGHMAWLVKATATASAKDGEPAPAAPRAPVITASLLAP